MFFESMPPVGQKRRSGNGAATIGSQYVSYDLKVTGTSATTIIWNANNVARPRALGRPGSLVRHQRLAQALHGAGRTVVGTGRRP